MVAHELTDAFSDALRACGGSAMVVSAHGLADAVAEVVDQERVVLVTPDLLGLAKSLRQKGIDARVGSSQHSLSATAVSLPSANLDEVSSIFCRAECGITGALLGISASGTVAIDTQHGNAGLLSCLPPHHVAILREGAIQKTLEGALETLAPQPGVRDCRFVLVTGPSRTSDIEMMSVLGVHGPLKLDVIIVREDA